MAWTIQVRPCLANLFYNSGKLSKNHYGVCSVWNKTVSTCVFSQYRCICICICICICCISVWALALPLITRLSFRLLLFSINHCLSTCSCLHRPPTAFSDVKTIIIWKQSQCETKSSFSFFSQQIIVFWSVLAPNASFADQKSKSENRQTAFPNKSLAIFCKSQMPLFPM